MRRSDQAATRAMPGEASNRTQAPRLVQRATSDSGSASEGAVEAPHEAAQQWAFDSSGVDADRRAEIALDVIRSQRSRWARTRRSALRPSEALKSLVHEMLVIVLADPANPDDRQRQLLAGHRILALVAEVTGNER